MISDTEGSRRTTRHKKKKKSLGKTILMVLGFVLLFVATVALTIGFLTIRPPSVSTNSPVSNPNNTIEETKEPEETEFALREKLPLKHWLDINTILVTHGQNICKPIKPKCAECPIKIYCPLGKNQSN